MPTLIKSHHGRKGNGERHDAAAAAADDDDATGDVVSGGKSLTFPPFDKVTNYKIFHDMPKDDFERMVRLWLPNEKKPWKAGIKERIYNAVSACIWRDLDEPLTNRSY